MARTSKTKIGGEGESSDRMMRAAESGAAMKQRAHEGLMGQHQAGQQQAMQMASTYGGLAEAGARRQQQDRQFDESIELDAAKSGFQRAGAGGDRAAALDAEMDRGAQQPQGVGALDPEQQQRVSEQTKKGIEYDGQRWVPTQERREATRREGELEGYKAETERMRAEAYRAQVRAQYGVKKAQGGDPDELKQMRQQLVQPIKSNVARFDRLQNGKQSDEDWASLTKMAQGFDEPQLQADLKARQWTPRVQAFLNATIAYDALQFIGSTGELPDGDLVDLSSPKMQEFTRATGQVAGYMKQMGPEFTNWIGITSMAEKTAFINKMGASMVLSGMTQPGAYQEQGGGMFGGMTPSAGQQPDPGAQQQPQGAVERSRDVQRGTSHPYATDEMTQRAIQARAAGDPMPPTDTREFRNKARGTSGGERSVFEGRTRPDR